MRSLTLRVYQVLTVETPVRFGFARAGWTPSEGQPDRSGPAEPAGIAETVVKAQASALFATRSAMAESIAASYRLRSGPVFIVNNVRYIEFLNDGTSEQAPKMFVELAIALAVRETVRELAA